MLRKRFGFRVRLEDLFGQPEEFRPLRFVQRQEGLQIGFSDWFVEFSEQRQTSGCNPADDTAAVAYGRRTFDKTLGFQAVDHAGDAWSALDHALRDGQRGTAGGFGSTEDSQDVVLLASDAVRFDDARYEIPDAPGCRNQRYNRVLRFDPLSVTFLSRHAPYEL